MKYADRLRGRCGGFAGRARTILAALLCGSAIHLATAQAADAIDPATADPNAAAPATLQEVIVTAERRAESLQKVPAQVDVFNAQQIAQRGIKSTADFVAEIPNMTFDRADTYHNS